MAGQKTVAQPQNVVYRVVEAGPARATVAAIKKQATGRQMPDSLHLFFDNVVAGGPSQVTKNSDLEFAATFGDVNKLTALLKEGADVHTGGDRPLQLASANGHLAAVECLLKHKANIQADHHSALLSAAKGGYADVVQILLAAEVPSRATLAEAHKLASSGAPRTGGVFGARRPTPSNGHQQVARLLSVYCPALS